MLTRCLGRVILTLFVISMVIMWSLPTTASNPTQHIPFVSADESYYREYQGPWHVDDVSRMLTSDKPLVPHPSVSLQGYTERLYVAYFGASWCRPCRQVMKPRMYELRKKGWKVYIFDVDIHKRAAKMLMNDQSVPKIVFMDKGQIQASITGQPSLEELDEKLKLLEKGYEEEEEEEIVDDSDSGIPRIVDYLF